MFSCTHFSLGFQLHLFVYYCLLPGSTINLISAVQVN